jgi:hypothetical protein
MASCDHIAAPASMNAAPQQASVASLALGEAAWSKACLVRPTSASRARRPVQAMSASRRSERGRSARSAASSSANSAPYLARQAGGYQRSRLNARTWISAGIAAGSPVASVVVSPLAAIMRGPSFGPGG